ncbi:EAL domain-containing protein [Salinicola salarius]|uniref:bifunctional diguanylate cyclase/phosphodiesterase n=1 Tax=Salinicola salarius TaxID=430457 RepID=UPI000DA218E2|nr:EAL domain-containing protein [Salinicola salarius]
MSHPDSRPYRLSLKWRAFALTSLILLGLAVLITWISYKSLMEQFQTHQQVNQREQRHQIETSLQSAANELKQLAAVAASSESLNDALLSLNQAEIAESLRNQWPTLQLDAGIDELVIFGLDGELLASYGEDNNGNDKRPSRAWLSKVVESEQPQDLLLCAGSCLQFAAVPILVQGENAGVLMVSRSLVDVMSYFQRSSGDDIALLTRQESGATHGNSERVIPEWDSYSLALTHQDIVLPVLKEISRRVSIEALIASPEDIEYGGRQYETSIIPLESGEAGSANRSGYFVSVEDVTAQLEGIRETTGMVFFVALAGWLCSEAFLLFLLWKPTLRIRTLSQALPGLARGKFAELRSQVSRHSEGKPKDEIDVLADTAVELSYQLERLKGEVTARGELLEQQVVELERERDLVSGLMNTAQVLVVVHGGDEILMANRYAADMLDASESRLVGGSFAKTFQPFAREFHSGQQESDLVTLKGTRRTIAWHHTPLNTWADGKPATISVGLDITDRKSAAQRISWLANRDPLTALYNRSYFEGVLAHAVVRDMHGAMLYMDLDRFKEINELGGHQAGDDLLVLVSEMFQRQLSHAGTIARLGGDEFAILMENASAEQAVILANIITQSLEKISLDVDGQKHRAVASIGIALYPDHGATPKELMASADFAMYRAKEDPAQRWHLLSAQADKEVLQERVYWEERIRHALEHEGFELWGQPIASVDGLKVKHNEVLLRMRSSDTGEIVSPGSFIPVAERSGQIVSIDRWVISESLKMMGSWGDSDRRLALNVSGQSLHDEALTGFLENALKMSGVSAHRLVIEVTETAAVTDFATARCILQNIRDLGCAIALDDFGVGFSSFYYLDQLPIDYIKIDGSFIRDLPENKRSQMIVKAIVEIAKGFGKKTVAEFVDREPVYNILKEYGVDYIQGYWLGKPRPFSESLDD